MNCKLSRESIIELQLIPPEVITDDSLCSCCKQRIVEHRNGQRIGRIPFTRYNILPRMKRACRKNTTVGIVVGTVVAVVIFVLSSCFNYLIAIRSEIDETKTDIAIEHQKNISSINQLLNTNQSSKNSFHSHWIFNNNGLNHKHKKQMILFVILWSILLSISILMIIIFIYSCSLKFLQYLKNRNKKNKTQGIPIPVTVLSSTATQI